MIISPRETSLKDHVIKQLRIFFQLEESSELEVLDASIAPALERLEHAFSKINIPHYWHDAHEPCFNVLHTDQYGMFLYYLSNTVYKIHAQYPLASKLYYLNKIFHSIDVFYEVELPSVFLMHHPVGSVLGRAFYSDYLSVAQQCTIGNNKGVYPRLGKHVTLMAGAMIIGDCSIGDHTIISARTLVKDHDVPANSIAFGTSPNLVIKSNVPDRCAYLWQA